MDAFRPYPLFSPPTPVADRPPRDRTAGDARLYFDWLTGSLPDRTRDLVAFFHLDHADLAPRDLLLALGERVAEELTSAGGSSQTRAGERVLTSRGHALAADMGLLIAALILELADGGIRWHIVDAPRGDRSFNLPVLTGFADELVLDPIAASIAEATGLIAGRRGPDAWARMLDFWTNPHLLPPP